MMKIIIILLVIGVAGVLVWPAVVERAEEEVIVEESEQGAIKRSNIDYAKETVDGGEEENGDNQEASAMSETRNGQTEKVVDLDNKTGKESGALKQEVLLSIAFAPQAPLGVWDQPYQDACEEAALIMVDRFLSGQELTVAEMDSEILKMVEWQTAKYGVYKDTNSAETASMAGEYFDLSGRAVDLVTAEDIKDELRAGWPVIVLVNGRKLDNPFYTSPGPEKHTLVIKGFEGDEFITNDPGTRRGDGYRYATGRLWEAMIDYDGREAGTGGKAMVVFSQ